MDSSKHTEEALLEAARDHLEAIREDDAAIVEAVVESEGDEGIKLEVVARLLPEEEAEPDKKPD